MSNDPKLATKAKILIVDDQLENLRLLAEILIGQGYEIRKAINGSTALMGVEAFSPDLILLDVNMPELDGYQVCQKLKNNRTTRNIPIIFLSASDQIDSKIKAFEVGGVDYITKPFQVLEVLARVKTQIKVKRFHQIRESLSKTIVHDLKNPLSVITIGSSALLRRNCLTEKNLEILRVINSNSQRFTPRGEGFTLSELSSPKNLRKNGWVKRLGRDEVNSLEASILTTAGPTF